MEPFALVIFGITGNLAQLMLIPALYDLEEKKLLSPDTKIIGVARRNWSNEELHQHIREVLTKANRHHQHDTDEEVINRLISKISYLAGNFDDHLVFKSLKERLNKFEPECVNRMYYLATYPEHYAAIFKALNENDLNKQDKGWVRLMIEKPIGSNAATARELDTLLHKSFAEEQIYRLDHYLGKETFQNILVFRFGNGLFQPLLSREHVDHIQITWAEEFGVGKRGGYFDNVGLLRDVGQNHCLQMLVVATMGAPSRFENREITDQRIKILQNLKALPEKIVFGQYNGYQYEENIDHDSRTDTFFALKTEVDNDQWRGVPIYIRAGKNMAQSITEISIIFKAPVSKLFHNHELGQRPNVLTYRIYPHEGIGFSVLIKKPGHKLQLQDDYLQYCYRSENNEIPDAYEKLIYDAISGDPTFFNDSPEVIAAWEYVDKMMPKEISPEIYEPGSWGPDSAIKLIEDDGRKWLEPSAVLCSV